MIEENRTGEKGTILIVTTVPDTLAYILSGQPAHLSKYFKVSLASSPGDTLSLVQEREGVLSYPIPMRRKISVFRDAWSVLRMVGLIMRVRPDIVHSYTPKAGLVAMLAAWLCRVPCRVHTFTGLIFPTTRGVLQKILVLADRIICYCATDIVPEGEGVKSDLQRFAITAKPLNVVGYGNIAGVDTDFFSRSAKDVSGNAERLRKKLEIPAEATIFVFVGRINRDKGIAELAEAFSTLPEGSHLLLVGGLDSSAPVSGDVLERLKKNARVHELGFLEDIRPALYVSDALVLPSYREGFPNVILQAYAMGLSVIATDISGCNEVVTPGMNGMLVRPRDALGLRAAMEEFMCLPKATRELMGSLGRALIVDRYEKKGHWGRMVSFYERLLEKSPRYK